MSGLRTAHLEYWGYDAEIEYYYEPGEPEEHTLSNGDPGTPGSPPSVEVERIWVELESNEGRSVTVDISTIFYESSIEEKIIEKYHE